MRAAYRARQFWNALTARPSAQDMQAAQAVLSPALLALFRRLQPGEQAHSLNILRSLQAQGETDPDLLTAALLHDVGKVVLPLRLWERVWIVIGKALFPRQAAAWSAGPPNGLGRAFVAAAWHAEWGAQLAEQAGAGATAAALIRRHQIPAPRPPVTEIDRLLSRLQALDDEN